MQNTYTVQGNVARIAVWSRADNRLLETVIDKADLAYILRAYPSALWEAVPAKTPPGKRYVQARVWWKSDKRLQTVMFHRLILREPDPEFDVHHKDNDGLNNRRSNLELLTHKENLRKRRPHGNWEEYDRKRVLAAEYRTERKIANRLAAEYGITRQQMYRLRMDPNAQSPAAIAYRAAIKQANVRGLFTLHQLTDHQELRPKFGVIK